MRKLFAAALGGVACLVAAGAHATTYNLGYMIYNVTDTTGFTTMEFDAVNVTGPNEAALGDTTDFPVTNAISFGNLSLLVDFSDGSSTVYPSSDFTANIDGQSWDGPTIAIGGTNPKPTDAILTGTFSPTTLDLFDDGSVTVGPDFTADFATSPNPLTGNPMDDNLDSVLITASTSVTPPVPEPGSLALLLTGLLGLLLFGHSRGRNKIRSLWGMLPGGGSVGAVALLAGVLLAPAAAWAEVGLTAAAVPYMGNAGLTSVTLTANGLPAGTTPADTDVRMSTVSCPANGSPPISGEIDTTALGIKTVVGSTAKVQFLIPSTAPSGTYLVAVQGTGFTSTDCSIVVVTNVVPPVKICLPSSSLAVLTGTTVTAYVPNGYWSGGTTGITAVNIEGPQSATPIGTGTDIINACSSNSASLQTVCTANNTDVYEITGTTVNSILKSGANTSAGFSGGNCENCGIAINAFTNTAIISGGFTGGASGNGVQALQLSTNTFAPPFPMNTTVSENISIDPGRALVITPDEDNSYTILSTNSSGAPTAEYDNFVTNNTAGGDMDSGEEDCTTGISFAPLEFTTADIYLIDLSQATLTPGSPAGTYTAPGQDQFIGTSTYSGGYSAGPCGGAVAPTTHLAIVQGEFGGNTFAALQLPSTSGTGTPALVDYAMAEFPLAPDCTTFSAGFDPHTVTAYTSPNTGKAYGVVADYESGEPKYVGIVDLAALLAESRVAGDPHAVQPGIDLVAAGIVRYVSLATGVSGGGGSTACSAPAP